MTQITTRKTSASAVVLTPYNPQEIVRKASASVVVLQPVDANVVTRKTSASVVVVEDLSGNAKQEVTANRPEYATSTGKPHVKFLGSDSLLARFSTLGEYHKFKVDPSGVLTVQTVNITDPNVTLTEDFNQIVLMLAGRPEITTVYLEALKASIKKRITSV